MSDQPASATMIAGLVPIRSARTPNPSAPKKATNWTMRKAMTISSVASPNVSSA